MRNNVWVNLGNTYYEGTIWKYHEATREYVVMLGEDYPEEERMLFVKEDCMTDSVVDVVNNAPHMDGEDGHKKNPNKIELFPQQTIERLIKNSVLPKRNEDGVIMISKDEMSYEEWGEWSDETP